MINDRDNRPDHYDDDNELWDDELLFEDGFDDPDKTSETYTPYSPHDYDYTDHPEKSVTSEYPETPTHSNISNDSDSSNQEDNEDYYADSEAATNQGTEKKIKKKSFFSKEEEDDDDNDFYDSDSGPVPVVKKVKPPKLDPEDPDYWIEEESPLSGIIPNPRKKWKWWLAGSLIILAVITGCWIWYFRPYVDNAVKYGYIKSMERRGSIIKTFEGKIIPYKELGDPNPLYFEELQFSVESDSLAARMKRMMLDCVPVRIEYEKYHSPLPWKGESSFIIIKADSADVNKIIPPEYR